MSLQSVPALPVVSKPVAKLTVEAQKTTLQLVAEFFTLAQVAQELKKQYNITISTAGLSHFTQKKKAEIDHIRQNWLARLADEPLANKRKRVTMLTNLYNDMEVLFSGADDDRTRIQASKRMSEILEQVRNELEGTRIQVSGSILHTMDDSALIEEAEEVLRLRAIEADWQELPDPDKEKT